MINISCFVVWAVLAVFAVASAYVITKLFKMVRLLIKESEDEDKR